MDTTAAASASEPEQAFDPRELRRCLSQYATGVTVITADNGEERFGVTANSFASLSLDPPLILWSIARTSRSFELFTKVSHFAVNILAADQIDISQAFSSKAINTFESVNWKSGKNGSPVLDGILASVECKQERLYDGGDHMIIVGRVEHFSIYSGDSLLFAQGRYRSAIDHPQITSNGQVLGWQDVSSLPRMRFFMQLFWAFHYMSENFEEYRKAANVTLPQGRILSRLYDADRLTLQDITTRTYLTNRVCEDSIAELIEQKCIMQDQSGRLSLTGLGRSRREALAAGELQFEKQQTIDISTQDLTATRRVLSQLIEKNQKMVT
jgi:flavin reductase (DIM6/NTAB) family NADH-FMN oxidoreductase RutF/DNA-binding MarR family transcriptional regulator